MKKLLLNAYIFKKNLKEIDMRGHNSNVRFIKVKSESKQYTVLYRGNFGVVHSPHSLFSRLDTGFHM